MLFFDERKLHMELNNGAQNSCLLTGNNYYVYVFMQIWDNDIITAESWFHILGEGHNSNGPNICTLVTSVQNKPYVTMNSNWCFLLLERCLIN